MPIVMNMPKIGVNMTDATIIEWKVKPGDAVNEGDHVLDAETDKAVQEIYATVSGTLTRILAQEGEQVLCQEPIAEFAAEEESSVPIVPTTPILPAAPPPGGRVRISPLARKMARDLSISEEELRPGAPGERIVKADVLAHVAAKAPEPVAAAGSPRPAGGIIPYTGVRKRIGDRMAESWQTKPAVALTLHAGAERLVEWRERLKADGKPVSYTDILVLIAARALREHPVINSRLEGGSIETLEDVNVGVAVDTDRGLLVPVIRNADRKGLQEIAGEFRRKVEAAKAGRAASEDITGGTFTITNLGMYEVEQFTPIINPPECCILALGAIVREPVAGPGDAVAVRSRLQMTLVFDHRIVDGAPAARFLQRVKHLVECPMELIN